MYEIQLPTRGIANREVFHDVDSTAFFTDL